LLLACPLPFVLIKYGERIRANSKYAAATTATGELEVKHPDDEEGLRGPVMGARRSTKSNPKPPQEAAFAEPKEM
jgi:hypothetical protein